MTAQEFIKKYPDSEINENCLVDVACPACGSRGPFNIAVCTVVEMSDYGSEDAGDIQYDERSHANCPSCGRYDNYEGFVIEGLDDLLRRAADHDAEQTEAFNKYGMQV